MALAALLLLAMAWLPMTLFKMGDKLQIYADPELLNTNISLLIAHPDDEVMFFGPSLHFLVHPKSNNSLSVLCLSRGNADGIGETREAEFYNTLTSYFPLNRSALTLVDDETKFKDSMSIRWDADDIAEAIETNLPDTKKIVTFDDYGISGHPNHISLYYGALKWAEKSPLDRQVYILKSVPIWRKFISSFDEMITYQFDQGSKAFLLARKPARRNIKRAMTIGYKSQATWFRKCWVVLSRYMSVNVLDRVV